MSTEPKAGEYRTLFKRALTALEELRVKLGASEGARTEPIAIVGMSCRMPQGANDPEGYWQLLRDGVDAITVVPQDRWDVETLYDPSPDAPLKMVTRYGAFLDRVDRFDPRFFGISPREAVTMDPQQRLLLEVSWEALERAGQSPAGLIGSRTGVFVGLGALDYGHVVTWAGDPSYIDAYVATGNSASVAAGRLSYTLGLQGPSLTLDTACSSSLVTVHLACQSLRMRESDLALAGGINVILTPGATIVFSKARMLTPDGRCKAFDARADGFVRGEGCGVVVLKRLTDALADRDPILAVIRGSAVNQDGRSSGLTAPNGPAQEAVIRAALDNGRVEPSDVGYVEAHGTGTALGDPIEVRAMAAVLGRGRPPDRPLAIGSVKTNIGHLEAAAGVAGLMKVVLALQHQAIPPHLHLREPNPHIPWSELPIVIPTALTPWPRTDRRRVAGVSSFGFSGTNAHLVLEEAPVPAAPASTAERPRHVLALSARSETALRELAGRHAQWLEREPEASIGDVGFTLNAGRSHFAHRVAIVVASAAEAAAGLRAVAVGETPSRARRGHVRADGAPEIGFLFTGQGSQYVGMGRRLYETQPAFRDALERCDAILQGELPRSLLSVLYPVDAIDSPLETTAYAQPALFAFEWALAALWRAWGVEPTVVLGHSVGEYVAAVVAGVMSLEDGLRLVAARGRLMQALPAGAMAAVEGGEERVRPVVARYPGQLAIAAVNGPESVVLSGADYAVDAAIRVLEAEGVATRRLRVSHAFHSPLVAPMLDAYGREAARVEYVAPRLGLVSNLTGQLRGEAPDAGYWVRHVREPVRFSEGMAALSELGVGAFVEVGPRPVLLGLGRRCVPDGSGIWLPSLRQGRDDWEQLLESLASLYAAGVAVDWRGFDRGYPRRKVVLPTYPFERQRYWVEPRWTGTASVSWPVEAGAVHPVLGRRLRAALPIFESRISVGAPPFLADHRVYGTVVVPAAVYLEVARAAGREVLGVDAPIEVELTIHEPLALLEDRARTAQVVLTAERDRDTTFRISSAAADGDSDAWTLHASGALRRTEDEGAMPPADDALVAARGRCQEKLGVAEYYARLRAGGTEYGASFQGLDALWRGTAEALARVRLPPGVVSDLSAGWMHPALLDACLQPLAAAMDAGDAHWPVTVGRYRLVGNVEPVVWSHVRVRGAPEALVADVRVFDELGGLVAEVADIRFERATRDAVGRAMEESPGAWLYEVDWQPGGPVEEPAPADFLPPPGVIATRVLPELARLVAAHGLEGYGELASRLDALCVVYVLLAFRTLGWEWRSGERVSVASVGARLGVVGTHHRLLGRLLEILTEERLLEKEGTEWEICRAPEAVDPRDAEATLASRYPELGPLLGLLARCGRGLAAVLRGETDPIELLFGGGSETAELYRDLPLTRIYNALIADAISTAIADRPRDRVLRVLEIGAGTGGTTASILQRLPADRTEYAFTDVSPAFLAGARRAFAQYPFVRYQVLDIEREPAPQGFPRHGFDIVVAANVLHATRDLRETMGHVRELLASEGLVVLLEGTARQRWVDLVFGLTEGWWRFSDTDLRPDHALLSQSGWRALLGDAGFTDPVTLPDETAGGLAHQSAVLARGPRVEQDVVTRREPPGRWLILTDEGRVGRQLAAGLRRRGADCVLVRWGGVDAVTGQGEIRLDPGRPEDFGRLVRDARMASGAGPLQIVHLWNLDATPIDATTPTTLAEDTLRGCGSVLHLVQALANLGGGASARLWIVTRGTQPAGGGLGPTAVAQAPVWGLAKTIALEHPELGCVRVDLDGSESAADVAALLAEVCGGGGDDQVALRRGGRYVARLVRSPVGRSVVDSPSPAAARIRSDATYLITGGVGGLGLLVARWLVRCGARHLALVGRRGAGEDSRQVVRELEASGARVIVFAADVSRGQDVERILGQIAEVMPPLRGVVHAAGVLDDGVLLQQRWERFTRVMAPKVEGAWHLHAATRDCPLDLFVLFSSAASVLGSAGQGNHAAANAFLDALAHARRGEGLPAVSINWGAWAEVGAAAERHFSARAGAEWLGTIGPAHGLRVLGTLLRHAPAQVAVLPIDWLRLRREFPDAARAPLFARLLAEGRAAPIEFDRTRRLSRERLGTVAPSERRRQVELHLTEQVGSILGIAASELDIRESLNGMGFDSLMAVELKNRIEVVTGVVVPLARILQGTSVEELALDVLGGLGAPTGPVDAVPTGIAIPAGGEDPGRDGRRPAEPSERERAARLLATLDHLSDEEVRSLLGEMLSEERRGS